VIDDSVDDSASRSAKRWPVAIRGVSDAAP